MKKGIHPNYKKVKVVCTSCGAEFESGSVLDEVRVDTYSRLENKDLLVLMDVLKNSTKNTDLNKKMSTWYSFLFWRKKWNIIS